MQIYCITCSNDNGPKKYYVGITNDIERRYEEHCGGKGSKWTSVYAPESYKILVKDADPFDEDKHVKILMKKHGIDHVRGGSYSAFHLTTSQKTTLYNEMKNATGRCLNCGKAGHFANTCKEKRTTVNSNKNVTEKPLTVRCCSICRKPGHNKSTCPKA